MECTCSAMQCTLQLHCSLWSVPAVNLQYRLLIHCRVVSYGNIFVHCTYTNCQQVAVYMQSTFSLNCSYTGTIHPIHSTSVWGANRKCFREQGAVGQEQGPHMQSLRFSSYYNIIFLLIYCKSLDSTVYMTAATLELYSHVLPIHSTSVWEANRKCFREHGAVDQEQGPHMQSLFGSLN